MTLDHRHHRRHRHLGQHPRRRARATSGRWPWPSPGSGCSAPACCTAPATRHGDRHRRARRHVRGSTWSASSRPRSNRFAQRQRFRVLRLGDPERARHQPRARAHRRRRRARRHRRTCGSSAATSCDRAAAPARRPTRRLGPGPGGSWSRRSVLSAALGPGACPTASRSSRTRLGGLLIALGVLLVVARRDRARIVTDAVPSPAGRRRADHRRDLPARTTPDVRRRDPLRARVVDPDRQRRRAGPHRRSRRSSSSSSRDARSAGWPHRYAGYAEYRRRTPRRFVPFVY